MLFHSALSTALIWEYLTVFLLIPIGWKIFLIFFLEFKKKASASFKKIISFLSMLSKTHKICFFVTNKSSFSPLKKEFLNRENLEQYPPHF